MWILRIIFEKKEEKIEVQLNADYCGMFVLKQLV